MGHRLSKIYTRTGDDGTTGLGDGTRTAKDSIRISAIGAIDELNSVIGLVLTESLTDEIVELLTDIQHRLFDLGGELSLPPGTALINAGHAPQLEQALDQFNEVLSPLKEFVLPGGTRSAALLHVARTVCRRAERELVALGKEFDVSADAMRYINRLSDLLFVLARWENHRAGRPDVLWQSGKRR